MSLVFKNENSKENAVNITGTSDKLYDLEHIKNNKKRDNPDFPLIIETKEIENLTEEEGSIGIGTEKEPTLISEKAIKKYLFEEN